jgi:hypothetical protein
VGALTDAPVKDHGNRVVVQGFMFFPRGGSAQVVRYLCHALARAGWEPRLAAGSMGVAGDSSHAATFFTGLDVHAVDFTPALAARERGDDPLDQTQPLHPSFEDRPGAPDRVFARVSPALAERQVAAWARALDAAGAPRADVLHLHHLTPLHDAALRVAPEPRPPGPLLRVGAQPLPVDALERLADRHSRPCSTGRPGCIWRCMTS